MRFLLDANTVIALLNHKDSLPAQRIRLRQPQEVGLPALVMFELFYGAFKSRRAADNLNLLDELRFEVIDFDKEDARHAGEIRALLAGKGTPIGPYDVLIAGQARARGLILVTHNTSEFGRVPDLKIEDWEV